MGDERIVFVPTVMVANVSRDFGAALGRHLRDRGWAALHVPRAREALQRWQLARPRALVTGFDDGDLDAFEFLGALRSLPRPAREPRARVILCGCPVALAELGRKTRRLLGIDVALQRPCRFEAIELALGRTAVEVAPGEPAQGPAGGLIELGEGMES